MEPIRAAAEKLVRCKGRYHSEQNYRALAALFGVTTPDLPPLDAQPAQPCEHSMFWDASGVRRCSKCDIPEHANVHYADAAEMEIAALSQRIAELESRIVKLPYLPDDCDRTEAHFKYQAALRDAGIKWEAE